ncbi:hypothetical protein A2801_03550 [Candidatus Woesebacteria bacterium RIFCSPHIGHO2_01_FULL_41_10]|uniref:HD domain-containing protein n=1 Tax=Candidatus Woesebacteria bacterium RIFCSPHIGHO2_01_FULL_41_10 TaxID=1802500 RepID=A0A1F7YN89_9BACT|nr:MAG: hypothetical protein A2801_03550 [Candidatus Woesebacteria bacterium RIFCSPHIGHO2_01_FULL_41_10]
MDSQKILRKPVSINVPHDNNDLLKEAIERVNSSVEVKTLWEIINVNAIDRMGYSDHGSVHFQIVSNIALRVARLLHKHGVEMSISTGFDLSYNHAELVIFMASLFHDLGMSIHRVQHEEFSLIIANNLLREMLDFLPTEERVIVTSEVLHAIIAHRSGGKPLTIEAGIVRVADALDMSKGRTRIPYEQGHKDIYSLSARAIESVEIAESGDPERPVQINIEMTNSSGIFQADELLNEKLKGSGIEQYVSVNAFISGETEEKLLKTPLNISLKGK